MPFTAIHADDTLSAPSIAIRANAARAYAVNRINTGMI